MSAVLESASIEYFSITTALVTTPPFTFLTWAKSNVDLDQSLLGVGQNTAVQPYHYLGLNGVAAANKARVRTRDAGGTDFALSNSGYVIGTWHCCIGVWASDASRKAYLDADTGVTESTVSRPLAGLTRTYLGRVPSTGSDYFDGKVAHAAIWSVALSESEIGQLAAGDNPRTIQSANLVEYWELNGNANGLNGNNWTANGTISFDTGDNPPVDPFGAAANTDRIPGTMIRGT